MIYLTIMFLRFVNIRLLIKYAKSLALLAALALRDDHAASKVITESVDVPADLLRFVDCIAD